jgi:hypothetical protein
MKKIIARIRNINLKESILNFSQFILSLRITTSIIGFYFQLDIKTKLESWGIAQYSYILSFIPITLLTLMSLILMIEGQLFHIFGDTRCQIYSLGMIDQYCMSYFGLMLGISVVALLQIYLYWHYVTSVKNRFFPSIE